jgi:hypothetical protein
MDQLDMVKTLLSWLKIFTMLGLMVFNPTQPKSKKIQTIGIQFRSGLNKQNIYDESKLFLNID